MVVIIVVTLVIPAREPKLSADGISPHNSPGRRRPALNYCSRIFYSKTGLSVPQLHVTATSVWRRRVKLKIK